MKRKIRRNRVVVFGNNAQWDVDLASFINEKEYNSQKAYALVAIDVFNKHCYARKLETKQSREVSAAMVEILKEAIKDGRLPLAVRSDAGGEFRSLYFQKMLRSYGINQFVTSNAEIKSNIVERVIRTIKGRLGRYKTKNRTRRWVDALDKIITSYNNTYHSSLGMTPNQVTDGVVESQVWEKMYQSKPDPKPDGKFKLKVGETVRLSKEKRLFSREQDERWTVQIYKVSDRIRRGGLNVYSVVDLYGEEITGKFYQSELEPIIADVTGEFNSWRRF